MQHNPLVGLWSADCIYGPGAQADTVLVFRPGGTGVREEWNFGYCCYDLFTWQDDGDGTLTITGIKSVSKDDVGQVIEEPSPSGAEHLSFSLAVEEVPRGGVAEVLTIVRSSRRGFLLTEKYGRFTEGRLSQDTSDYQLPF